MVTTSFLNKYSASILSIFFVESEIQFYIQHVTKKENNYKNKQVPAVKKTAPLILQKS